MLRAADLSFAYADRPVVTGVSLDVPSGGFVGIIGPHAIRLLTGANYRALLPLSMIGGAGFLGFADVIARTALSPAEIPLGVVTAFFGAPFFAIVLRSTRVGP